MCCQWNNGHMDRWNRLEWPEISSLHWHTVNFDVLNKRINGEKNAVFNK